ncbi:MAG: response regulator [Planctomycetes bacterium]|nr:response regulator [Planctomycetota bacterium]
MPDGIVTTDERGLIASVNPAVERLFQWPGDELLGRRLTVLFSGPVASDLEAHFGIRRSAELSRLECGTVQGAGTRKDGTSFPVTLTLSRARLPGGLHFVAVLHDDTPRARSEEAMLAAPGRVSALVEAMHAAVALESESGTLLLANRRYRDLFGLPADPQSVIARDGSTPPESAARLFTDPAGYLARTQAILDRREPVHNELIEMADGRSVERDFVPIVEGTAYTGHFWLYRDVTERVCAETALRDARDAAEQADRAKAAFLAAMSHEIRTPMSAIVGYADVLARPQTAASDRFYVALQIRRNAEHLLSLLNDILDLSRIEAGRMPVDMKPASVKTILGGVVPMLMARATEKAIGLRVEFAGRVPVSVTTDAVRIRQVLLNLVSNAVKFTDRGGVTVRVSLRPPAVDGGDGGLVIAVEDTGIGIAAKQIPRLFGAFNQAHESRARVEPGTGLGLAISKRLVVALGGTITVESTPGAGSRFTVEIPVAAADCLALEDPSQAAATESVALPATPAPRLEGKSVLVVDDNADNRRIAKYLLYDTGAAITTVDDGRACVNAVRAARDHKRPFDLILMDLNLPVLTGLEATAELRAMGVTVPIVALSAYTLREDVDAACAAGCNAYLTKPVVAADLFATIVRLLTPAPAPAAGVAPPAPRSEAPSSSAAESVAAAPEVPPAPERRASDGTKEQFAALVESYVAQLPARAEEIHAARRRRDDTTLRTIVHRLRGTGATIGFPEISVRAGELEDALRGGAPDIVIDVLADALLESMAAAEPPDADV